MESKVLQNPQRISFLGLQNAPKTNHTTSRRKFNKSEGTDKTLRKIDHLMKFQKSTFKI